MMTSSHSSGWDGDGAEGGGGGGGAGGGGGWWWGLEEEEEEAQNVTSVTLLPYFSPIITIMTPQPKRCFSMCSICFWEQCSQFWHSFNFCDTQIAILSHLKFGTLSVITCTEINLQSLVIWNLISYRSKADCILSRRFALLLSQLNSKRQKEVHGHLQCFCQKGEYCINFSHNQKSIQNIPSGGFLFCQKGEYSINFSHNQISIEQTKYPIRWF